MWYVFYWIVIAEIKNDKIATQVYKYLQVLRSGTGIGRYFSSFLLLQVDTDPMKGATCEFPSSDLAASVHAMQQKIYYEDIIYP